MLYELVEAYNVGCGNFESHGIFTCENSLQMVEFLNKLVVGGNISNYTDFVNQMPDIKWCGPYKVDSYITGHKRIFFTQDDKIEDFCWVSGSGSKNNKPIAHDGLKVYYIKSHKNFIFPENTFTIIDDFEIKPTEFENASVIIEDFEIKSTVFDSNCVIDDANLSLK